MNAIVYVNGRYRPYVEARIGVEDRGYQFSDGVYEGLYIDKGQLFHLDLHFDRLQRSLAALRINLPMTLPVLKLIMQEVIRRNGVVCGSFYLQITRGVAPRYHPFPKIAVKPGVVMMAHSAASRTETDCSQINIVTRPDPRWKHPHIKSLSLLGNVLVRQEAVDEGAEDVWMVDGENHITEASAANSWIILADGTVVTRPLDGTILPGITRHLLLRALASAGVAVIERCFTPAEAYAAREAFITSTTRGIVAVVRIDDHVLGNGSVGLTTLRLREIFAAAESEAVASGDTGLKQMA